MSEVTAIDENRTMTTDGYEFKIAPLLRDEAKRYAEKFGEHATRRVLLVGGAGYIGTPIATELMRNGFHVRNLDLFLYNTQSSVTAFLTNPAYELIVGDLGDSQDIHRALVGVTDVVVLGGLVGDPITKAYPDESRAINEISVCRCLDALNGRGLNKVIFISTCSNYGLSKDDKLVDETSPLQPLSLYAKAKVAAEEHLLGMKGRADFCGVILRFATAFGVASRMRFDLTVNEFTRELFVGDELVVYDAHTWRPYCHVRDFARLIVRVLLFPAERIAFEVFNAGGDENNHTKQSIIDIILSKLPEGKINYMDVGVDRRNYRVDFCKVRESLYFEPVYDVPYGVTELISALRAGFFADYSDRRNFYGNYDLPHTDYLERRYRA
jgi:nucleoside-diphosphate-sugar epimerase